MRVDLNQVHLLFRHELRSLLRDRKTLFFAVLLPLAIMPLMLYSSRFASESTRQREASRIYRYAVSGSEATLARDWIRAGLEEKAGADSAERGETTSGGATSEASDGEAPESWRFEEAASDDPAASLEAEEIHFYLVALSSEEAAAREDPADSDPPSNGDEKTAGANGGRADSDPEREWEAGAATPVIQVFYRGNRHPSRSGARRIEQLLVSVRDQEREELLGARGIEVRFEDVLRTRPTSVARSGQVAGSLLGRFLTLLIVFMIVVGGASVATDLVAGEKERGTLETLLTSSMGRAEIITGKVLLVTAVALLITLINVGNLLVYVGFGAIPLPEGLAAAMSPATVLVVLVLLLPVAVLIAGVLLLVSSFAKTYKEAQTYFFPLQLLMIVPPLAALLPGIELRSAVALLPLANISVGVREVLVGTYDWPMLALSWLVTAGFATYAVRAAGRLLSSERYVLAGGADDTRLLPGPARLARQLPLWLIGIWGLFLLVNLNYPPETDIRLQAFVNLVFLFLGSSVLLLRFYRLPWREALAVRAPRPIVWVGVLLAAPATPVVAHVVARLSGTILPVPERALEEFSKMILPEHVPIWQMLLILTILPGICEEILFRGVFLYAFRRRLGPVALVLASGLVFGMFHVDLFRIAPTAFIGILLATATLLTGSILPAMVWHALANATSVGLSQLELDPARFGNSLYAVGGILLGVAFVLLWRGRSFYPGLRSRSDP